MAYVKLGSPPAIGNVVRNTGEFSTVGVGAAAVTSALYVNKTNRIGAWITGSNVSTGVDADGLFIDASFAPSANVVNCASIGLYPTFNPPGGVTITTGYGLYIASGTAGGAGSTTTGYGLFVTHPTFGTTNYAAQIDNLRIDLNSITATNANGTLTLVSDGTGACNLGTNATAHTTTVGSGTTTSTTTIDCGTGGANFGTTANAHATTVGSTNSTSATTLQSGSGALNITSTNGALAISSGTGAMNISTDGAATVIALGTGAAVKSILIGSTTTTSATNLQAGSGGLNLNFPGESTLTHYQEGTFTPVLKFGGGTTGITYTTQLGLYTRIGRIVHVIIYIVLSSKGSSTGNATITGLPFTSNSTASFNQFMPMSNEIMNVGAVTYVAYGKILPSTTQIEPWEYQGLGATVAQLSDPNYQNTSVFYVNGSYFT